MSNEKALLILAITPNPAEMETFSQYVQASGVISGQYGANVLARLPMKEQIYGDMSAALIGIAEFPSAQAIKDMFGSTEYKALIPDRDKSISSLNMYISAPGQMVGDLSDRGKATLVTLASPNPAEKEAMAAYGQGIGPISAQYGGQTIGRIGIMEQIAGDSPAAFLALAQFPNAEAIKGFFGDDEYQKLLPLRDRALSSLNLYIA